ncbi:MAG: nucleoside hydrolase [Bacteroidota bacterium]
MFIVGRILSCFFLFALFCCTTLVIGQKRQIIVDADSGNEVDDLYALVRILLEPSVEVTALNATHWQTSHWTVPRSMENSHRLNQQLLGELRLDVKTLRGGAARMYDWGDRAQHSAAAYEILRQATEKEEVTILALGALTNIASAVFIQPAIAKKLKVYWLGTTVDFKTQVVKRNDFNAMMDPFALDYLLDSEVEMHIMPINVATAMEIDYAKLKAAIASHPVGNYLLRRWEDHLDGSRKKRVLWDLGLITAYIHPEFAQKETITTSRDSGNRPIQFYKSLDAETVYQDFYKTLLAFERE